MHHHHASSPLIKHLHGLLMSVHAEAPYGYTLGFHLTPTVYFTNTDDNDSLSYDDITKQSFDNICIYTHTAPKITTPLLLLLFVLLHILHIFCCY